ncbi:MAG: hypothetical protein EA398_09160 [Deltaproteobacteria bacterium]|nr:MAG: hypothetical protein EA398_09160 [Deltaproteobacteria bacterium]
MDKTPSLFDRLSAVLDTEVGLTFAIIGASFLFSGVVIVFVLVWLRRMFNPAVLRTGTPAPGVIRTVEITGTRINGVFVYRFEVEVTPREGDPFRAWVRRPVPPHESMHAVPGQPVTVRYNPERPQKEIALAAYGHADVDTPATKEELFALVTKQQAEKERLSADGLPATAIVVERTDMPHRVNRIGVVSRLRLKVIGADGVPYDATTMAVIHQQRLERYAPGAEVPVRFDPASPTTVAIDASRSMTVNPGEDPLA